MTPLLSFKFISLTLLGFVIATGCNRSPEIASSPSPSAVETTEAQSPSPEPTTASETTTTQPNLISADGIGEARLGMTLGELKQELGTSAEFEVQSPFIVDFDAIAVRQSGEVKYYILHLAGQPLTDDDTIQGLFTDNSEFKTDAGVGPGTPIADAEATYGEVTLSYNIANEGREYARFENQPSPNISFATGNGNAETAGVYPTSSGEFQETQEFREEATIQSVLVVCLSENCAQ